MKDQGKLLHCMHCYGYGLVYSAINIFRGYKLNSKKILEALSSCYFYLNALRIERMSFWDTLQYPCEETIEEADEFDETDPFTSEMFLKEYFQTFNELAWKQYAEVSL